MDYCMCEFHDCNCNGLGDTWWTDKCTYFSSIDVVPCMGMTFIRTKGKTTVFCIVTYMHIYTNFPKFIRIQKNTHITREPGRDM